LRAVKGPLSQKLAERLARSLKVHWTTIYRWHKRLTQAQLTSALAPHGRGFPTGKTRLTSAQENVIRSVLDMMRKRRVPLRIADVVSEVQRVCVSGHIPCPARSAVDLRIRPDAAVRVRRRPALEAANPPTASGTYRVSRALDVVQIDHTLADVIVLDDLYRQPVGRPYLTLAMDVATRSVLAIMISFDPPSATTVALCLTRICSAKTNWLRSLDLEMAWPMAGIPRSLHLDNGPEFYSRALQRGCGEFGIDLIYRPPGRTHFGGHIERLIGTLMDGLKRLPGATGSSVKDRKPRKPEKTAQLTLTELERWLAIEIGERYHHSQHRGLGAVTPFGAWAAGAPVAVSPERLSSLPFAFLPAIDRRVQREGLFFNLIRYWHPIFSQWAPLHKRLVVHYDARDLSKLFARGKKGEILEIPYADLRRPPISLWEYEAVRRYLRKIGADSINEGRIFKTFAKQNAIVEEAARRSRSARHHVTRRDEGQRQRRSMESPEPRPQPSTETSDIEPFTGEVWTGE
jgi:putative transposase